MKKTPLKTLLLTLILPLFFVTSCKKPKAKEEPPEQPQPNQQLSDADSLKYLMYNIMQVSFVDGGRDTDFDLPFYYWYKSVPKTNSQDSKYSDAQNLLNYMKNFATNPATGKPYDKYSFLDNGEVAGEIQQGVAGDLGMQVSYAYDSNDEIVLVVLFTDKNSPAGLAGVNRGWQITSINGTAVKYDGPDGTNVNNAIKAIYDDDQASFVFKRNDGSTQSNTLAKSVYNINPVLFDSVFTVGAKKVGYFVFGSFANIIYNNNPTLTRQELNRVFAEFEAANISDLIVDLRYNGGGAVPTAEYLDSKIAPSSVAGKEMYRYLYNDKIDARKNEIEELENKIMFKNGGNLNLDKVYFITGRNTASASELTINNLLPYMDVQRVGDTSYGKPVGFFGFHISIFKGGVEKDLADLYAINFETRNANNQGQYYEGMVPNEEAVDYIGVPWGQPGDENLEKIFNNIATGSYERRAPGIEIRRTKRQSMTPVKGAMHPLRFNGMVDYKMGEKMQTIMRKKAESNR